MLASLALAERGASSVDPCARACSLRRHAPRSVGRVARSTGERRSGRTECHRSWTVRQPSQSDPRAEPSRPAASLVITMRARWRPRRPTRTPTARPAPSARPTPADAPTGSHDADPPPPSPTRGRHNRHHRRSSIAMRRGSGARARSRHDRRSSTGRMSRARRPSEPSARLPVSAERAGGGAVTVP